MAREIQVLVPDIGDFEEVEIVEVLVAKGDSVKVEDSLVTLESDKATMEIPSPAAGVVCDVRAQVGDLVSEGSLLVVLSAETVAEESTEVDETASPVAPRAPAGAEPSTAAPETRPGDLAVAPAPPVAAAGPARTGPVHASPLVRKVAREWGVDVSDARGSGPHGRVLVEDLKSHVGSALKASSGGIPPVRTVDFARFGEIEEVPLSRIRQRAGRNLSSSWLNLPHVTQHDEADITLLEAFRKSRGDPLAEQGVKLSPLVFVMKAVVLALRRYPEFASSLAPDGKHLILKKAHHLGIAVETEGGLVVPVVRDVAGKRLIELAREAAQLAETARAGRLSADQMQGACFTISSLGGIGGTAFTPIVNAPEVALLGVSRAVVKPVWSRGLDLTQEGGGEFEPRLILPLSLSYDHRVIDGAAAVRFTSFLKSALSDPARLLL